MKKNPTQLTILSEPIIPQEATYPTSHLYKIVKYGQYAYQLYHFDPLTNSVTPIGVPNVYQVIAADLTDRLLDELTQGNK